MKIRTTVRNAAAAGLVALAVAALAARPATGQETGAFTLTQADKQIGRETFTRSGVVLETELEVTGQGRIVTKSTLGPGATVARIELRILPPGAGDAEPLQSLAAEFRGDSVRVEQPIGTQSAATETEAGMVPYINPSPSYLEQIVRRARAEGGSDVTIPIWAPGPAGGQTAAAQVTFDGARATLTLGAVTVEIDTDEQGRLLAAEVPAQGLVIERQ